MLGPYQLQTFVSLVVVLGAALVALICDLLKGNNEQLRELTVELKVRREEEHKRFEMMLPMAVAAVPSGAIHVEMPVAKHIEKPIEKPI